LADVPWKLKGEMSVQLSLTATMPENSTCRYARLRISLRERVLDHSRQDETNDRKLIEDARVRFCDNGIGTFGAYSSNGISTFVPNDGCKAKVID
jgi:hypothetical protein